MKYSEITAEAIADYLKSWNSFEACETPIGFGRFEMQARYNVRVVISHDDVRFLSPGEEAENEKSFSVQFHTAGDGEWVTQEDWYSQYDGENFAFPWEAGNSESFQHVCAEIAEKIKTMRPAKPLPPLDVNKHGFEISDEQIRAIVEESKKLGPHGPTHDELRLDVTRSAYLCYDGENAWLYFGRVCDMRRAAWMMAVLEPLTPQGVCDTIALAVKRR